VNPQDLQQDLNFVVPIFLANFFTFISNIFVRFYRIPPWVGANNNCQTIKCPWGGANVASKWNTNLNPNSLYEVRPLWLIPKTAWVLGFRVIAENHIGDDYKYWLQHLFSRLVWNYQPIYWHIVLSLLALVWGRKLQLGKVRERQKQCCARLCVIIQDIYRASTTGRATAANQLFIIRQLLPRCKQCHVWQRL